MKRTLLFSLGLLFHLAAAVGQVQIVSDTDWGLSQSQNGPFNLPVYEVTNCVNEAYIDAQCGGGYGSPMLDTHFTGCPGMKPIWVTPPPADCYYSATGDYWFQKNFSVCGQILGAQLKIQGDQKFTLYVNGTLVGSTGDSDWNVVQTYDVASLLMPTNNTILVRVDNINGGSCFNYAFLAFCLYIEVDEMPFVVTPMSDISTCPGQAVSLQASPGGSSYTWAPALGLSATNIANPVATPMATTTYTVTITDPCGMAQVDDVVVTVLPSPNAMAANDGPFCPGEPVQLSASGGSSYTWSGPSGFTSSQQNPFIAAFATALAGTYTVTATSPNGCTRTASTLVESLPIPDVSINGPLLLCLSTPGLQLTATPAGGIWGGVAAPTGFIEPATLGLGVHQLSYTYAPGAGGCTVMLSEELEIVNEIEVSLEQAGPFCPTSPPQNLLAEPPGGTWGGATNDLGVFDPAALGVGFYTVSYAYTTAVGCSDVDSITVEVRPSMLTVDLNANELAIILGETSVLDAVVNVPLADLAHALWLPLDTLLACPACLSLTVNPFQTTNYTIQVTDIYGCQATDALSILVDNGKNVFVPNVFSPNDDGVNDAFTVFADPIKVPFVGSLKVFGRWGEMIYEAKNFAPNQGGWDGTHRGEPVNMGTYTWLAEVSFADNTSLLFSGSVTVIR